MMIYIDVDGTAIDSSGRGDFLEDKEAWYANGAQDKPNYPVIEKIKKITAPLRAHHPISVHTHYHFVTARPALLAGETRDTLATAFCVPRSYINLTTRESLPMNEDVDNATIKVEIFKQLRSHQVSRLQGFYFDDDREAVQRIHLLHPGLDCYLVEGEEVTKFEYAPGEAVKVSEEEFRQAAYSWKPQNIEQKLQRTVEAPKGPQWVTPVDNVLIDDTVYEQKPITPEHIKQCMVDEDYEPKSGEVLIRKFDTGADRDLDQGKFDYEGFLSPTVLEAFAAYMHLNRTRKDGTLRDSDNWQKGIPQDVYMKSAWRHFHDWWTCHRDPAEGKDFVKVEALCALMFNVMGYLHEELKK